MVTFNAIKEIGPYYVTYCKAYGSTHCLDTELDFVIEAHNYNKLTQKQKKQVKEVYSAMESYLRKAIVNLIVNEHSIALYPQWDTSGCDFWFGEQGEPIIVGLCIRLQGKNPTHAHFNKIKIDYIAYKLHELRSEIMYQLEEFQDEMRRHDLEVSVY
jgi:hypothetical protein